MKSAYFFIAGALWSSVAAAQSAPRELELRCSELPSIAVTVDESGQVSSQERIAREFRPIDVRIINTQHLSGGRIVSARVESSASNLETELATWRAGESVSADRGGFSLDLRTNMLFVTEPVSGNEALFRRFECERSSGGAGGTQRYDCGGGYELTITLGTGDFGEGEAYVQHPEGRIRLTHVPSGSGARYANRDNELWIKGDEALFTRFDGEIKRCRIAE